MPKRPKSTKKLLEEAMWGPKAQTITNKKPTCKMNGVYKWPNNKGVKQSVDVDVTTWAGWSLGATHYYAKINVESNKEWCETCLAWHTPINLKASKGFKWEASVETKQDAIKFVDLIIANFLNEKGRYLVGDNLYETPWAEMKKNLLGGD